MVEVCSGIWAAESVSDRACPDMGILKRILEEAVERYEEQTEFDSTLENVICSSDIWEIMLSNIASSITAEHRNDEQRNEPIPADLQSAVADK